MYSITSPSKKIDQMAVSSEINLTELGYTKLLGSGKLTKALTIQVKEASKSAQQKVQNAGGKLILSIAEEEFETTEE